LRFRRYLAPYLAAGLGAVGVYWHFMYKKNIFGWERPDELQPENLQRMLAAARNQRQVGNPSVVVALHPIEMGKIIGQPLPPPHENMSFLSHTHTHILTHTLTRTHTLTLTHTHTHTLSHTHSHTHTNTHTHTHTLTHTHARNIT